jgi:hypothetical protein
MLEKLLAERARRILERTTGLALLQLLVAGLLHDDP